MALTVQELVTPIIQGYAVDNFDYYIYNNRFFTPVEVEPEDIVDPNERLLHICLRGVDPATDRFLRPQSVYTVESLYRLTYLDMVRI